MAFDRPRVRCERRRLRMIAFCPSREPHTRLRVAKHRMYLHSYGARAAACAWRTVIALRCHMFTRGPSTSVNGLLLQGVVAYSASSTRPMFKSPTTSILRFCGLGLAKTTGRDISCRGRGCEPSPAGCGAPPPPSETREASLVSLHWAAFAQQPCGCARQGAPLWQLWWPPPVGLLD